MDTVLITYDEAAVCEDLKYIIDWAAYNFTVCGTAANGDNALATIKSLDPSLILMDTTLPDVNTSNYIRSIRSTGYSGKIILIGNYSALIPGPDYYLARPISQTELIHLAEVIQNINVTASKYSILDDILHYINDNYNRNLKLETIAPLFGYNSAYLGKIFSKLVGESFNNYVDHIRIEHAKQLVLENNLKVYEIAECVGYNNVDYFHKKFKKYVGENPAEFRNNHNK